MTVAREERTRQQRSTLERILVGILTYRPDIDGRLLLLGALATYFTLVAVPRMLWDVDLWPRLGVPSGPSLFFDTRNLTAALECRRLGLDPLIESPCDPWARPLNYPRVWLLLRFLGLNQSHTVPIAILFIVLFLGSIFLLVGRMSLGRGIVVAIAVCSPSVMFAIERANMDIVVFTMTVLAILVWRIHRRWSDVTSPLVVLLAATTKIYPVFALPAYLFARRRTAAIAAIVCAVAFAIYALLTLDDIRAVAAIAPQGEQHSFGARILPAAIYHRFIPDRWQGGAITKQILVIVPLLAAAALVWLPGRRRLPDPDVEAESPTRLAFCAGSLIFLGTFAIGNNFDYRLVFLLLTLPQLFDWVEGPDDLRGWLAAVTLTMSVVLLWIGALSEPLMLWDELVTWAVVGLLVALLAASIPSVRSMVATIRGPD
jgi:Glycosyltransferase family 87